MKRIVQLSPLNSGTENSRLLQSAVDSGGEVCVMTPGVYCLADAVLIGDHTHLYFAPGVYFERVPCEDGMNGYVFINKGAFDGKENCDISIEGLYLFARGVESTGASPKCVKTIPGERGHISFVYIRDLVLRNITVIELGEKDYGVQISDFHNVLVESLRVEGNKDGIHFGPGKGFIVRHAVFRTYDAPIALNGSDYSVSNPHLGWIEDGLIEDAYDLADHATAGYFARLLAGAWGDWFTGMEVQQSDTVVYNGRLYRVSMPPDGRKFISLTPPTHEWGYAEYDGIRWCCQQRDVPYSAGCRNITFRNIFLQKKRPIAFALELNEDDYLRSYYPGATPPVQSGIRLENIHVQGELQCLLRNQAPLTDLTIVNCDMKNAGIVLERNYAQGLDYPVTEIRLENVKSVGEPVTGDLEYSTEGDSDIKMTSGEAEGMELPAGGNCSVDLGFIQDYCEYYHYPEDAVTEIVSVGRRIMTSVESLEKFQNAQAILFDEENLGAEAYLSILREIAGELKLNDYIVPLVFYLCAVSNLEQLYAKKRMPAWVCQDSLRDLLYKVRECKAWTGCYGLFSPAWFYEYFRVERFGLGRLQYDVMFYYGKACRIAGRDIRPGDYVLRCHIPRSEQGFGKEERMSSYKLAYRFAKRYYPEIFREKTIPIMCVSWLLFPLNERILPETSNIVSFMREFKPVDVLERPDSTMERIFNKMYQGNPLEMPADNALQRGYRQWLLEGNVPGEGHGVMLFDGEKIIID